MKLHLSPEYSTAFFPNIRNIFNGMNIFQSKFKGLVHDNAHARRLSLPNKFVGSTLNSKSPLPVQSLKILRFIRTSVPLAGLVILR